MNCGAGSTNRLNQGAVSKVSFSHLVSFRACPGISWLNVTYEIPAFRFAPAGMTWQLTFDTTPKMKYHLKLESRKGRLKSFFILQPKNGCNAARHSLHSISPGVKTPKIFFWQKLKPRDESRGNSWSTDVFYFTELISENRWSGNHFSG